MFTSREFDRFARKAGIGDVALLRAVESLETGMQDAKLGGGLSKQRLARKGEGKSGGYRTLIVFRSGDRAVFIEGYAKNVKGVHTPDELKVLRRIALGVLSLSDSQMSYAVEVGEFRELEQ